MCIVSLTVPVSGCAREAAPAPVTLTLLEEWTTRTFSEGRQRELDLFTRETGIQVRLLPSPESARDKLALWQSLLETGAAGPDVFGIDVIWPLILNEYFIDLSPYFAKEIALQFPAIVASYRVGHKLVAIPYRVDVGLLFYRTDLLRQYGYRAPPATWDALETMAARIQAGERAKGKKEFWGFVWQGTSAEALTCNALEWQAAVGGGRIIEDDSTISVNNPRAIRAWERAARWVGSISPPSVVGYTEWDALNMWIAGDAAFMRNWPTAYVDSHAAESPIRGNFDITLLPAGAASRVGTLGGAGLAVSRFSPHPREAVALVRFLTRGDVQATRSLVLSEPPTLPALYDRPDILASNPHFPQVREALRTGTVSRPSNVTGKKYQAVTDAYVQAVHSVLTGRQRGPTAAAALERELVRLTDFRTRLPQATQRLPNSSNGVPREVEVSP
jgi:trehalose/maltose transport system substrate-binding protein